MLVSNSRGIFARDYFHVIVKASTRRISILVRHIFARELTQATNGQLRRTFFLIHLTLQSQLYEPKVSRVHMRQQRCGTRL